MSVAVGAFALKEIPMWFLPVITAAIIDIVAGGGEVAAVLGWFALAAVLLLQNYPNHILYTRSFMTVVRDTGADLRNALAARLQSLSIGYHSRVSSSIVQTKVVRDVENVELMLQQVTHPLLSATMVMLGALSMTAVAVPQFLPVYALAVPIAIGIRYGMRNRSRQRNEIFRREVEVLSARVGEMASLIPVTRAHGLEQTAVTRVTTGAEGVDAVIDACDQVHAKTAMAAWALKLRRGHQRFISVGAAGGKRLAHKVDIDDLSQTTHDPLLAQLRYRLRKQHGAPRNGKVIGIDCVFSREAVAAPDASCAVEGDGSLNCHGYGSAVSLTATFGMVAAGHILDRIAAGNGRNTAKRTL